MTSNPIDNKDRNSKKKRDITGNRYRTLYRPTIRVDLQIRVSQAHRIEKVFNIDLSDLITHSNLLYFEIFPDDIFRYFHIQITRLVLVNVVDHRFDRTMSKPVPCTNRTSGLK